MRERLIGAPWWVLSLVMGTLFGSGMFVFGLIQDESRAAAAIAAVGGGVFFGLVMGPLARRANARAEAALGEVTVADRRLARRAAWRGPVPLDPEVRRAALGFLDHQVATYRKLRWAIYLYGVLLLLCVSLVVTDSRWYALELPLFAALLFGQVWMPRHLVRRRPLLLAAQTDVA